jgi:hypothetical protein
MANLDHNALAGLQLHSPFHYEQAGDPGAVGAFKWWYQTTTGILRRRNSGDTGWDVVLDPGATPTAVSWKATIRAATTAAGTLASSFENGDTIDGVVLSTGDRILIKDQAAGAENGIYVVAASGAPARASDADSAAELLGAAVIVREGTVNADTGWLATPDAITLGVTSITWTKIFPSAAGYSDPLTTRGDIVKRGAAATERLAIGTAGQVLKVTDIGAGVLEPRWGTDLDTALTIREVDGAPSGTPTTLKFPNGTLTDNGDGSYTYTAAAGSSITIQELDGTPSGTPTALKFPNGTLTDNGDGTYTYTPTGGSGVGDHGCHVYASADQSASDTTWTGPNLANERYDTDGYHFTSAAALTGTVAKTAASAALVGTGTSFTTELSVGQIISVPGTAVEKKVVTAIADNTHLTVASAFANTASGQTATRVNYGISIPSGLAGRYVIRGRIYWATNSLNIRYARLWLNDTTRIDWAKLTGEASDAVPLLVEIEWDLAVNDLVELQGLHTVGSPINLLGSAGSQCSLQLRKVA